MANTPFPRRRRTLPAVRRLLAPVLGGAIALAATATALGMPVIRDAAEWIATPIRLVPVQLSDWSLGDDRDQWHRTVSAPTALERLAKALIAMRVGMFHTTGSTVAPVADSDAGGLDAVSPDMNNGVSSAGQSATASAGITNANTGGGLPPALLSMTLTTDLSYVDTKSSAYSLFKSYVDQAVAGNPAYGFAASDAVIMYSLTAQKKYCDLAISMVEDQVSAAESKINSGSVPEVAGDSYLYVGPMIQDVSATYSTCKPFLTSSQTSRWSAYAEQSVWNVWNYKKAKWGSKTVPWSGWGTDNPGNNYFYSFLTATMYWGLASGSQAWIDYVNKQLIPPLTDYFATLPGGGSLEGTGYGTSHMTLFADYMLWRDSAHVDLANRNSHATDSISYWAHATVPTLDRFAPYGDQARSSTPDMYDYQRRLMLEARYLTLDKTSADIASWWLKNISIKQMSNSFNRRWDLLPTGTTTTPPADLIYQATGVGQLFARTSWTTSAMWVSFIAGKYNESHAHQEQGGFTLFSGDWLAVTENIWTNSGIQQGTSTNNILRFEKNGSVVPQALNTTSTMSVVPGSGGSFNATANLKPAYGGNSAVGKWNRQLAFANRTLTVTDDFTLGSGTKATFQVNVPVKPTVSGSTVTAGKLKIRVVAPSNPTIKLVDWTSVDSGEYTKGWRVDISGSNTQYVVVLSDN